MTSILDQYDDGKLDTILEEPEQQESDKKQVRKKKTQAVKRDDMDIGEKREQLSILSVLGTIENYTGVKMSLGDVKKLPAKDVENYYNRYQITLGNQVTSGLVDTALETCVELVSYALPIDDKQELCNDLKKNELVKKELTNAAGYVVLKGGRFVALASGLLQIAKHIDLSSPKKEPVDDLDEYIKNTVDQTLEQS